MEVGDEEGESHAGMIYQVHHEDTKAAKAHVEYFTKEEGGAKAA